MKIFTTFLVSVFTGLLLSLAAIDDAEAKRMGGGRSFGGKSTFNSPYKRSTPASPSRQATQPMTPAQTRNAQARQSFANRGGLMGMLGGLAIGGLLGALLFGGAFENINFFDILLFGLIAFILYKLFAARRRMAQQQSAGGAAGAGTATAPGAYNHSNERRSSTDAGAVSGRPTAGNRNFDTDLLFKNKQASPTSVSSDHFQGQSAGEVPAGFDKKSFLKGAERAYQQLQASWDKGDLADIRRLTTDAVYQEIERQFNERSGKNRTDILNVKADLLEIQEVKGKWEAAVLFNASLREFDDTSGDSQAPHQVEEIWHFTRSAQSDKPTWFLDGIQQVQ